MLGPLVSSTTNRGSRKPNPRKPRHGRTLFVIALLLALLIGARTIASYTIEYEWWKEMGQTETWFDM